MDQQVDGRRLRGDRTRRTAARYAAALGTVSGLESVSISRLSAGTGLSRSGILTVFHNREAVQLAAIAEARRIFVERVVSPAWLAETGPARVWALIENWFGYVGDRVFPGGCFMATTSAEFGAQQGPLADAIREMKREWLALLEDELGVDGRESARGTDLTRAVVFELDAFMAAASTGFTLFDDPTQLDLGKAACRRCLDRFAAWTTDFSVELGV